MVNISDMRRRAQAAVDAGPPLRSLLHAGVNDNATVLAHLKMRRADIAAVARKGIPECSADTSDDAILRLLFGHVSAEDFTFIKALESA